MTLTTGRTATAALISAYERSLVGSVSLTDGVAVKAKAADNAKTLGILDVTEKFIAVGRTADNAWLWAETRYGQGYIRAAGVKIIAASAADLNRLAVVVADLPAAPPPPETPTDDPTQYPILPAISPYMTEIYRRGAKLGNRPTIFAKVGDCMSTDEYVFLGRFASDNYDLGEYKSLQQVIDHYRQESPREGVANSFVDPSIAAHNGFNAASVLDSTWLEPGRCPEGTSPLACQYQLTRPAVAIIMFGTNDVLSLNSTQFEFYMRLVVHETLARGIVPILNTFPGNKAVPGRANRFNQAVYRVGIDYDVPVVNLWLALQPLPGKGIDGKAYLSLGPGTRVSHLTPENLKYGYTVRNLLTLQALGLVLEQVISGG